MQLIVLLMTNYWRFEPLSIMFQFYRCGKFYFHRHLRKAWRYQKVISNRQSKNKQYIRQMKRTKGITMISQTMHMKYWSSNTKHTKTLGLTPMFVPGGLAVPTPLVTPVMLLSSNIIIIWYWNRVEHQYTQISKKIIKLRAKQMRGNTNRTLFWRGNHSEHHNMELKTWKQVKSQHEQNKHDLNGTKPKTMYFPQVIEYTSTMYECIPQAWTVVGIEHKGKCKSNYSMYLKHEYMLFHIWRR